MSIYRVIFAAIVRKISAVVEEMRTLVDEAKSSIEKIVTTAEGEAASVVAAAKLKEAFILGNAQEETKKLEEELIAKISKL